MAESCTTASFLTWRGKYRTVGDYLKGKNATGRVLDIGARDRVLARYLPRELGYTSADRDAGCDYVVDLEAETLTLNASKESPNEGAGQTGIEARIAAVDSFDTVIALDVLEHVDQFHRAFAHLAQLAKERLVIALPNMGYLWHRLAFLLGGQLATDKYQLSSELRLDRHRWLTTYRDIHRTLPELARQHGFETEQMVDEIGSGSASRLVLYPVAACGLPIRGWATGRVIGIFRRVKSN